MIINLTIIIRQICPKTLSQIWLPIPHPPLTSLIINSTYIHSHSHMTSLLFQRSYKHEISYVSTVHCSRGAYSRLWVVS